MRALSLAKKLADPVGREEALQRENRKFDAS